MFGSVSKSRVYEVTDLFYAKLSTKMSRHVNISMVIVRINTTILQRCTLYGVDVPKLTGVPQKRTLGAEQG